MFRKSVILGVAGLLLVGSSGSWSIPLFSPQPTPPACQGGPPELTHSEVLIPPLPFSQAERYDHDLDAIFHPHGDQQCASGCAASRHPTRRLTRERLQELLATVEQRPLDDRNPAFEELLYFGPQALEMWQRYERRFPLAKATTARLVEEWRKSHVGVQLRLLDSAGNVCAWLPATQVPLDRRHVFTMRTDQLPPLIASGTVKRVGVHHLWTRL